MEANEAQTHDNKNTLTPEQVTKVDRDLETISAILQALQPDESSGPNQLVAILGGGYATEAQCGGQITRPHGDIDLAFLSQQAQNNQDLDVRIKTLLDHESAHTDWIAYPEVESSRQEEVNKGHIEFREAKKPGVEFNDRRRIEIGIVKTDDIHKRYDVKTLINSKGQKYEVKVTKLHLLIAEKVRKIYDLAIMPQEEREKLRRQTNQNDLSDLKKLINLPGFTEEERSKTIETLGRRINKDIPEGGKGVDPNVVFTTIIEAL